MLALVLLSLVAVSFAQDEGFCECGLFVDILESGFLPPNQRTIGPVYELPQTSTQTGPCNSNVEALCDAYCENQYNAFRNEGFNYDTYIEYEVSPGVFENRTIGEISCENSLQLHPQPGSYDGTLEGGSPTQLQIRLNPCSNWIDRREYSDFLLCCDESAMYMPC